MGMTLKVQHTTGYEYGGVVTGSYNEARMTPPNAAGQVVVDSHLEVDPVTWSMRYRDYWGTLVTAFEVHDPHLALNLEATSLVQVNRRPSEPLDVSWDDLADPGLVDRLGEYLELPPRVRPASPLADQVREIREQSDDPAAFAQEVCALVNTEMEYVQGSTQVHSTAQEVWDERAGVCQDMAHVCLGALRSAGVPARYVSGYLHPATDPVVDEPVTGESHAWLEWWGGRWVGSDPTNGVVPDDRYVVVGAGRDYADIAPLTGIFNGGHTSTLYVEVTVTRTD